MHKKCNIRVYDDLVIKDLINKYPLNDEEYLLFADHFIADLDFNSTKIQLYPFQDIKYKELGGTNWKKEFPDS